MAGDLERQLVALLDTHGALVEPALLAKLATDPDDALARVQAVLASLEEIPFYLDTALWENLEARVLESTAPTPVASAPATPRKAEAKQALKAALGAIYDGGGRGLPTEDDEDDVADDHDDELALADADAAPLGDEARRLVVRPRGDWQPIAAQHEGQLEVIQDMTGNSTCEGTTRDFVDYFQDRYEQISKMLRSRRELRNTTSIDKIRGGQKEIAVIAMVESIQTTKNGHRRIELEDPTGTITSLVRADEKVLVAFADTLVQDEVIGVVGAASAKGDLIFVESLVRPDIPRMREKNTASVPLAAAFLSDIHVGSNTFLPDNWAAMIRWLGGDSDSRRARAAAGKVKYLIMPGDLVDGIGIYPGQQHELTIGDIYDQYKEFGRWMEHLPDHLEVVVQPGNHDAARPAEPQPAFSKEVRTSFDHHNTQFLANPAWFKTHGVTTLGYHGFSLIDFATSVTNLGYEDPLPTMEQMLQCRHLSPIYGERTPLAPEHHDHLVISEVPDLFVTGHVHVPGLREYRGVLNINSGTWQSQTGYQKMLNFTPDPARMPYVDLQTLRGTLVDFQDAPKATAA